MKYRSKPVIKEAIQWDGTFSHSLVIENMFRSLLTTSKEYHVENDTCFCWKIATLEGSYRVFKNDYIVKGIKGEFYPVKPDIFEASYERMEDETTQTSNP